MSTPNPGIAVFDEEGKALGILPMERAAPPKPQYEIPEEIARTMPAEKYIQIVSRGDYSGIYGTPAEAAFLFMHAVKRGYDPWKNPFQFIVQGKQVTLYAKKEASIQKKALNNWTVKVVYQGMLRLTYSHVVLKGEGGVERVELVPLTFDPKMYEVVVEVWDGDRFLEREVGVYPLGEDRSAAMAYTRAKRRAILAAAGESTNDESEFDRPPTPAPRTQETPTRREPAPEPPKTLPSASVRTLSTPSGSIVDAATGEDLTPMASVAPGATQGPSTGTQSPAIPPLPRKLPPSKPPMVAGK